MTSIESSARRDGGAEPLAVDPLEASNGAAETSLSGQAREPVAIEKPAMDETLFVTGERGVAYLLNFAPEDARLTVEGDNLVLTFDQDDDGVADSRIVFLNLAGMTEGADVPILLVAGVSYDVSALLKGAQAFAESKQYEGGEDADVAQLPAGPAAETAGDLPAGRDGDSLPRSGGTSAYQDNTDSLEAVGGPLGGGFGPETLSGTVLSGFLSPVAARPGPEAPARGVASSDGASPGGEQPLIGQVVDGYVANATVFRDANNNGQLDDGEAFTTTDINGNFVLEGGSGPLVAVGGTDVSTGLPFDGVLKAPEGSTVITPLTTLVQQLVESGKTATAAEAQIKQALGIDAGFKLSMTDPVAAAAGGDATALKAVQAGIQVANTAVQVKAALKGGGATDDKAASDAAFKAIAKKIGDNVDNGAATNLKDADQIGEVLTQAAQNHEASTGQATTFDANDIVNTTKVIAATNTVVESVDVSGGTPATAALVDLAKVAQVAQQVAAQAIQEAVQNNNDAASEAYDDASKVQNEAANAEVGAVTGSRSLTEGADNHTGTDQADSFDGFGGNDTLRGEGGNDAISGGAGNDLIYGGTGNDVLTGGTGNDTLYGDEGNDDIAGNAGDDLIFGGEGNDTLAGGAGNDTIDGGDGIDVVRFDGRAGDYRFDFAEDGAITVTNIATSEVDRLTNVESLRFIDGKSMTLGAGTVDVSNLGSVSLVFGDLAGLTQIATVAGQSLQLDGSQIHPISQANETLTIVGNAAVNIVGADLVVPNDGTQPSVNNLLALEFAGLDAAKSLIPANLTVDGSHTDAFAAFWIPLDQLYVGSGDYYSLAINTSFVYLGNDYASHLAAGGAPLLDLVKVTGGRLQTLHDNLLGNLGDGPITSRFINHPTNPQPDPRTADGDAFGERPYHDGRVDDAGLYSNAQKAAAAIAWDIAHGITYPDGLPAPFGVLDTSSNLTGTAGDELFFGGGGNDSIDGGDGADGAAYLGSRFDYTVAGEADGSVTVTAEETAEGTDTLTSIETLYFADGTLRFGAALARAVPEVGDGNDGFHPGTGNSDINFIIHDNTEAKLEAAIKATARYHGDLESDGQTYYATLGFSDRDADGLADENSDVGFWNFNYSVVDYGEADLSRFDIEITADFRAFDGNVSVRVMTYDPIAHDQEAGEAYYQDGTDSTAGTQNSQNLSWNSDTYNAAVPGTYTVVLTVTDKETGEVVAETQMQVVVRADITVGEGGIETIQQAIDAASAGDTIYVPAGVYEETVIIDKLVKLYGAFGDVAGSDAARGTGETVVVGGIRLLGPAKGSTIDGFTIQDGADIGGGEVAGIYLAAGATDVIIENNVFDVDGSFTGARGILTTSGGSNSGLIVSDNSFSGWSTGAYLNPGAADAEITGNDFAANNVGVSVDGPDGAVIAGNSFADSGFEHLGLGPGAADPTVTLADNVFDGSARAVGIYDDDIVVTGSGEAGGVTLILQDGVSRIALEGSAALLVEGNDGDNVIVGNAGANRLEGGAGDDTLIGGAGDDTLIGGAGADVFVFADSIDAGDLINGFSSAEGDRIDLSALLDALGIAAADRADSVAIVQSGDAATVEVNWDSDSGTTSLIIATVTNIDGDLTPGDLMLVAA